MINVMHVSPVGMASGGTEQAIYLQCRHCHPGRIANFIWSPYGGGSTLDQLLSENLLAAASNATEPSALIDFVNRNAIDVIMVHAGALNPMAMMPPLRCVLVLNGPPVIEVMHRAVSSWGRSWGVHKIVAISDYVASKQQSGDSADVITIHNGVDLSDLNPSAELRVTWRQTWAIDSNTTVVGFLGRLTAEKGLDDLLQVAARFKQVNPSVMFLVGGDGPIRSSLEESARNNGLDNVRFVGTVQAQNKQGFYSALDVFVTPARNEGFGLTTIESMAMGLPVIAYADGATPELFSHLLLTPLLAPLGDINALTDAIKLITTDAGLREQTGALNRTQAQRYSINQTSQRYETLLLETTANKSHGSVIVTAELNRQMANLNLMVGNQQAAQRLFNLAIQEDGSLAVGINDDLNQFAAFVSRSQSAAGK